MADCRVEMRRISMLYRWTEFNLTTNLPVQTGVDFLLKKNLCGLKKFDVLYIRFIKIWESGYRSAVQ